ncbi:MAG TPA: hypothetical protein VMT53_03580 [Terriglobales bacterium]|nr:hypothetical protein [Terriglobales bacterium]
MRPRVISLIAVVSLLVGIVQLPLPAVAAATAAKTAKHSHHHCCPKPVQTQGAAVAPVLPSLPCGPNHSCCIVRAPAKLPSLPAGTGNKADRQLARTRSVGVAGAPPTFALSTTAPAVIRSALELSTVLRI